MLELIILLVKGILFVFSGGFFFAELRRNPLFFALTGASLLIFAVWAVFDIKHFLAEREASPSGLFAVNPTSEAAALTPEAQAERQRQALAQAQAAEAQALQAEIQALLQANNQSAAQQATIKKAQALFKTPTELAALPVSERFAYDYQQRGFQAALQKNSEAAYAEFLSTCGRDCPFQELTLALQDQGRFAAAQAEHRDAAYQNYLDTCNAKCAFRNTALTLQDQLRFAIAQKQNSLQGYENYLQQCNALCAFRNQATAAKAERQTLETEDQALFAQAQKIGDDRAYQTYLGLCVLCLQREAALAARKEKAAWQAIADAGSMQQLQNYLKTCQVFEFRQLAETKIAAFAEAERKEAERKREERLSTPLPTLRTLTGHGSNVNSVTFTPDGQTLASGSWKEIKLWPMQ